MFRRFGYLSSSETARASIAMVLDRAEVRYRQALTGQFSDPERRFLLKRLAVLGS